MKNLFHVHPVLLTCLACMGSTAVAAGPHYTVRLKEPGRLGDPTVHAMQFSPDGSQLAVAHDRKTSFIRTQDGELTGTTSFAAGSMAYSRDGSQLLLVGNQEHRLLDLNFGTSQQIKASPQPGFIGLGLERRNGKLLVSLVQAGGPVDLAKQIHVGDELTGVGRGRDGFMSSVTGGLPGDAVRLIAGPAGTELRLRTIPRGSLTSQTHLLTRHAKIEQDGETEFVPPADLSIDEQLAFRLMYDFVEFSSTQTGRVVTRLPLRAAAASEETAVSPDSKYLVTIREVEEISAPEPKPERRRFVPITATVVESVRDDLVAGTTRHGYVADVFDVAERRMIHSVPLQPERVDSLVPVPLFYGLSLSDDAKTLVVGTWSRLNVYDVASGQRTRIVHLPADDSDRRVRSFAISAHLAAVGGTDGTIRICDFETGRVLRTIRVPGDESVTRMTLSADGHWLACYVDGVIHLVDVSDVRSAG